MSETMEMTDYVNGLPLTASTNGKTALVTNGEELERVSLGAFARQVSASMTGSAAIKISNVTSVLIAVRRTVNSEGALIWVSSYTAGQASRTIAKSIHSPNKYGWYINGASDSRAAVYLTSASPTNETVVVTSLFGEQPIIEKVSAVPADATPLSFV